MNNVLFWAALHLIDKRDATEGHTDPTILQVEGLLLATVSTECSEAVFADVAGEAWLFTLRQWLQDVVSWYMSGDKNHTDSPSEDQARDVAFRVFYRTILGGTLRHREVDRDIRSECEAFRSLLFLTGKNSTDCCPTIQAFVTQICRSRRLFLTTDGQLGIGPDYVQPGDGIFALSSAAVPLLLRLRPHEYCRWESLGEVYVNGMVSSSDDYGPDCTSFAYESVRLGPVKALPSQRARADLTSGTLDSGKTLDRNTGKATTRANVNKSSFRIVQTPYNHLRRKNGTLSRVQRRKTFLSMSQPRDPSNEAEYEKFIMIHNFVESSVDESVFGDIVDDLDFGKRIVLLID